MRKSKYKVKGKNNLIQTYFEGFSIVHCMYSSLDINHDK